MSVTIVKQVVAEVRGKTDQLDRDMAAAEQRIGRTKKAIEGNAASVGGLGNRYGQAAVQIAGASEQMARAGSVAGGGAKQILAAGSQIAFAFGPAGAIVGALSIFALAAAQAFNRTREEMEKTAKVGEETIARLLNAGDVEGLRKRAQEIYTGTAADRSPTDELAPFSGGVRGKRRRIAELEDPATLTPFNFLPRQEEIKRLRAELVPLEAEFVRAREALLGFTTPLANAASPLTVTAQRAAAAVKEVDALAQGFARASTTVTAAMAAWDKDVADFGRGFDAFALAELATHAERVGAAFDALIDEGRRTVGASDPRVQQLEALRASAVAAATAIETAQAVLHELDGTLARGGQPTQDTFKSLTAAAAALSAAMRKLREGSKDYLAVEQQLLTVEEKRQKLLDGVGHAGASGDRDAARTTADLAREIQQAVDGALQLAAAFGTVDASVLGLLRSIGQVAGNLPGLAAALGSGNALGVLSSGLAIGGALASLFGESPADAARREELRRNTDALAALTKRAGLLGLDVAGASAARAQQDLGRLSAEFAARVARTATTPGQVEFERKGGRDAKALARTLGINVADLEALAAQYRITLNGSIESFEQLQRALADTITQLGEFGTDLESQRQQAEAEIDIFGITDPLEQLRVRQRATAGRSPALDRVTAGLDLSTAEGREQARKNARELFNVIKAGGDRVSADDLDGLNGQELLDAILQLVGALDGIDDSLGLTTSTATRPDQVVVADRTQITVDQASRLLGLSASQLSELRLIREAVTAAHHPLALPSASTFARPTSGVSIVQHVEITITGDVNGVATAAAQFSESTLRTLTEYVSRQLGERVRVRQRYNGEVLS